MAEAIYLLSAGIVLLLALAAVLHPDIQTGVVGTLALGSAMLCGLAGLAEEPPRWVVGATASMAVGGLWAAWRWRRGRRS